MRVITLHNRRIVNLNSSVYGRLFPSDVRLNSLASVSVTIDLTHKDYEEMRFVTDTQYCGKGFSGIYEQIACHDTTYPIYPVNPATTTQNPYTDPPPCNRFIGEETFVLEIPFTGSNECSFNIQKHSPVGFI